MVVVVGGDVQDGLQLVDVQDGLQLVDETVAKGARLTSIRAFD